MRPPAIVRVFVLYSNIFFLAEIASSRNFGHHLFSVKVKMSSQPGEDNREEEEIEEGEIVSDEEDIEFSEGGEDDFFPDDDGELDLMGMMTSLLATPDGDTVCSALVNISNQIETQNRILIKMLAKMQSQK
jgi:hypothetical protein